MSITLSSVIRVLVPYGMPALGGAWVERSGLVTLCLEGAMLVGAFVYASVDLATGQAATALSAAVIAGACVGAVHAALCVRLRVDAMVSGIALNTAAYGGTRFGLKVLYGSSSNSPATAQGGAHAWVVPGLFALLLLGAALSGWLLERTRFGLRVRAAGDAPDALEAIGRSPERVRATAAVLGCAIAACGGVALVADLHKFQSGMSAGRGFLALVAIVIAGRRPGASVLVASAFAVVELMSARLQSAVPSVAELAPAIPYVAALAVVAWPKQRGV